METNEKLLDFKVGPVPTVLYIPDFITDAEATQLSNHICQAPISKWKSLKNRRLQNWGGVVHEKGLLSQDLPPWLTKITQRIYEESGLFPAAPNHVLINEYLPDQGIMPHQDGPAYFPAAAIISLGSPAVMNFTPHSRLSECSTVEVEADPNRPNKEESNSPDYLHGIEDKAVQRYDGAVNLTETYQLMPVPSLESVAGSTTSGDVKTFHRTTTRISLTCRLVLKVRKNLIKI